MENMSWSEVIRTGQTPLVEKCLDCFLPKLKHSLPKWWLWLMVRQYSQKVNMVASNIILFPKRDPCALTILASRQLTQGEPEVVDGDGQLKRKGSTQTLTRMKNRKLVCKLKAVYSLFQDLHSLIRLWSLWHCLERVQCRHSALCWRSPSEEDLGLVPCLPLIRLLLFFVFGGLKWCIDMVVSLFSVVKKWYIYWHNHVHALNENLYFRKAKCGTRV